ncbi:MAG TPA: hypothetical protein VHA78_04510 [Candidatus Peribacteraceae bacterium]|nr:hypothetical protein [Candidatus Peribacteraceae bacterium]
MDRYEKDQYRRRLIRRLQRKRKEEEERRRAYYGTWKDRWKRRGAYVFDSIEGNAHDAWDHFTAAVAGNLLRICYGILMLVIFFYIALSLIHNVKSTWLEEPQQQSSKR